MRSRVWKPACTLAVLALLATASVYVYREYLTPEKVAVRQRLNEADTKSKAALGERLVPVTELFAKGRKGAPEFAKEALSWSGKWALIKGVAVDGAHNDFLAEAFARHVFAPDDLRDAMLAACLSYGSDLDGVEAEMLVRLRADLEGAGRAGANPAPHLRSNEAFTREYRAMAIRVAGESRADLGMAVGTEVVVLVATDLATRAAMQAARAAAVELGVQSVVLGTGATSMITTLGVGLIVALIIDAVISEVLKMAGYDPEAKIAAAVVASLDRMEAALLRDSAPLWRVNADPKGALRVEMEKLHAGRSKLRRETVELMLKEGGAK